MRDFISTFVSLSLSLFLLNIEFSFGASVVLEEKSRENHDFQEDLWSLAILCVTRSQTHRSGILFVFSRITLRDVDRSQNALREVLSRDIRDFHLRQVTNFNKTLGGHI